MGRTEAPEGEPVRPVPEEHVAAVLPHLFRQVKAMVELQTLTGMRPGEVCVMRTCDVDRSGRLWTYKPGSHKTAYRSHERTVYIGPKAQRVLEPFLKPELQAHVFSPAEAEVERRAKLIVGRTTPLS
jgi:integrase